MKTFQLSELKLRIGPMRAFLSNRPVPRRTTRLLIGTALVGLMVLGLGGFSPVAAATILVNDNADGDLLSLAGDGKCQLREAIEAVNTNTTVDACSHDGSTGLATINFDLQGIAPSGNSVIKLYSPLIVTKPVVIDGTSDPDWPTASAPTIEINGGDNGFDGFILETGSDGSSIQGFQLMDFTGNVDDPAAIRIKSSGNFIRANYIGTDGSNSVSKGNDYGVYVAGSHNTIGGSGPGEGNLISVNSIAGVYIVGKAATGNTVQGNMMGTFPDGTTGGLGNKVAVLIDGASSNLIGVGDKVAIGLCGLANPEGSECNVITSSNDTPVDLGGAGAGVRIIQSGADIPTGNLIRGNYIGLGADGKSTWANYYGVHILAGSGNWVGGLLSGQGNTISANTLYGIYLDDPSATALLKTTIARNKIGLGGDGLSGIGNLGSGIYVNGTKDTIIGNAVGYVGGNLIGDNGSGATDAGITVVDAVNLQILGNRFGIDVEDNPLPSTNAIYIAEGVAASATVKIYGNRISNHAVGILDNDPEAALISDSTTNCIIDNTMGYNNTSGSMTPRPFSKNWWGDPTGPFNASTNPAGLGDDVSDNVTYMDFLKTAPTTCDPFAPTLKRPKNGSGIYFPKVVKFGWGLPRNIIANNFLQIDADPAFTSLEVDDGSGLGVDVTLMTRGYSWLGAPMGKYYWRIKALSPEGFVGYSPVWTFYVTLLMRPKNNAILTDITPIFKWKPFPLALSYDLYVGTSPTCGASPVISVMDSVDTSYKDELNPLTPGTYYWCVQPDNGPETPVYTFTIPAPAP
jgi:hypothetical protein